MPAPGEQERGRRSARPRADHDDLGLHHAGTLAERAGCRPIALRAASRTLGHDWPGELPPGPPRGGRSGAAPGTALRRGGRRPAALRPRRADPAGRRTAHRVGGAEPYAFIPLALFACIAGSLVGYSWARAVGDRGLKGLARRLRQQRNLERVEERLRAAGWQRDRDQPADPRAPHLHHAGCRCGSRPAALVHPRDGAVDHRLGRRLRRARDSSSVSRSSTSSTRSRSSRSRARSSS